MKYVVTRDQANEHNLGDLTIAVWEGENTLDILKMDSDGMWAVQGVPTAVINELTTEDFEKEYGIVPPKAGSKGILVATYEWE